MTGAKRLAASPFDLKRRPAKLISIENGSHLLCPDVQPSGKYVQLKLKIVDPPSPEEKHDQAGRSGNCADLLADG